MDIPAAAGGALTDTAISPAPRVFIMALMTGATPVQSTASSMPSPAVIRRISAIASSSPLQN